MKNIIVLPLAICLLAFVVADASAQYGNYGNHGNNGRGFGSNYYSGNHTDPRLGYCLNNDCMGGGNGGYGGGCGGGSTRIIVRVTTSGHGGAPTVQSYYPQIQNGCNGYYGNNSRTSGTPVASRSPLSNRYRAPQSRVQSGAANAVSRAPATASNTGRASYRYKF